MSSSYVPDDITALLSTPIEQFINTNVVIMESDKYTDEALKLIKERGVRSVLVSHLGEVVGIVSKTDILFKVMSQGRNPGKVKLREIMTSPVLAVGPHNTVQETLSILDKHVIRQVIVSSHSAVLGMASRDDIFEKIHMSTLSTAHTAIKGTPVCIINPKAIVYMRDTSSAKLVCPYCESPFDTKEGLSNHIDRLHSGSGVLEGDVRRMFE
jgi:signal-transduction protein with cAMP-binding, CBS, and nucleotidyltransferase domain